MNLRKNKAFSLLEVVCSIALLTGGFLVAALLMSQIALYSSKTQQLFKSINMGLVALDSGAKKGDSTIKVDLITNKQNIPFKKVEILWKERGKTRDIIFVTYCGGLDEA